MSSVNKVSTQPIVRLGLMSTKCRNDSILFFSYDSWSVMQCSTDGCPSEAPTQHPTILKTFLGIAHPPSWSSKINLWHLVHNHDNVIKRLLELFSYSPFLLFYDPFPFPFPRFRRHRSTLWVKLSKLFLLSCI